MNTVYELDTRTLLAVFIVIQLLLALVAIRATQDYGKPYTKIIAIGWSMIAIGALLALPASTGIKFTGLILGNYFLVLGSVITAKGFLNIIGKDIKNRYIVILSGLHLALFLYFTYADFDTESRILILASEIILVNSIAIYLNLTAKTDSVEFYIGAISLTHSLAIAVMLIRVINALFYSDINDIAIIDDKTVNVNIIFSIILTIIRAYLMILVTAKESQRELENLCFRDHLTNIYNKRYLMEYLDKELAITRKHDTGLGIVMFDIDNFKLINDAYGHLFGDEILKGVARIVQNNLRGTGIFGRYGGEEFMIIFRNSTNKDIEKVMKSIMKDVRDERWSQDCFAITFSTGILSIVNSDNSFDVRKLIDNVDKVLYSAKGNGKDRIETQDHFIA